MHEKGTQSEAAYFNTHHENTVTGQAELAGLVMFPLKSGRAVFTDEAYVDTVGLRTHKESEFSDRNFMVTDTKGKMESQRSTPALALLEVRAEGSEIVLIFHGDQAAESLKKQNLYAYESTFRLKVIQNIDEDHPVVGAKVHQTEGIQSIDQGDPVSQWLTQMLGEKRKFRLLWQQSDQPRERGEVHSPIEWTRAILKFADSSPYTAMSFNMLRMLNDKLGEENSDWYLEPLSFRMNMLFSGEINEHSLVGKFLKIGDVYFYIWRPKERCPMPATNQETGEIRGENENDSANGLRYRYQDILKSMHDELEIPKGHRFNPSKSGKSPVPKAMLGIDLIPINHGYIKVGDKIEVLDALPTLAS